jgi:hypothetical protein
MKIDLYNNFDAHRKELDQSGEIRQWARAIGISPAEFEKKIETHPFTCDLKILIDLNMFKHYFNNKDEQVFKHIWHQVYQLEYPLTVYHRKKLTQIVDSADYIMKKAVTMMSKKGRPLAEFN